MPFPFAPPSTSNTPWQNVIKSTTHPSLPLKATAQRAVLRNVLKSHRKRSGKTQPEDAAVLLAAIQDYLPYLSALNVGIHGRLVNGEVVNAEIKVEATVHWRSTLLQPAPSRPSIRVKGKTVDFEVCFVLTTLAYIYNAQARTQLLALYGPVTPSPEQRTAAITAATKLLLEAAGVHLYLNSFCVETDASSGVLETLAQTQAGLSALALAEATLLAVLKDDPYPAVVAQDRNKNDREWMIKPPEIPKVRAHLFARLCLAAADHAGKAEAMFRSSGRMDEDLVKYASNLKKTARARACRFFGIDAELGGETGKAIAWLMGGKKQLGFSSSSDAGSKLKGIAKLKKDWTERREDKKVERGEEWGSDAGKFEEGRVIEMLEQKWNKMNDTINTQLVPTSDPLLANLPSGREIHSVKPYMPPQLDADTLAQMRAPPDPAQLYSIPGADDSSDDDRNETSAMPPGAFPDSSSAGGGQTSSYY